jgi:hypothetical protein
MRVKRLFHDREHAGRELAKRLAHFGNQSPIVRVLPWVEPRHLRDERMLEADA